MGMPRRSEAHLGSSESIYDDLRYVRVRRGFAGATSSDLAGSLALRRYDSSGAHPLDELVRDFESFVEQALTAIGVHQPNSTAEGVAAESLRAILFDPLKRANSIESIRFDVGGRATRSWDYVRDKENRLLRQLAVDFRRWAEDGESVALSGTTSERASDGATSRASDTTTQLEGGPLRINSSADSEDTPQRQTTEPDAIDIASSPLEPIVTITIELKLDPSELRTKPTARIEGAIADWQLAMIRMGAGGPEPGYEIVFIEDPARYEVFIEGAVEPMEVIDGASTRRRFEEVMIRLYADVSENVVRKSCRIVFRHFSQYIDTVPKFESLISAILGAIWVQREPGSLTTDIVFDSQTSHHVYLPVRYLPTKHDQSGNRVLSLQNLDVYYMVELRRPFLLDIGIPAIIARWLEGVERFDPGESPWEPQRFFEPGNWQIRES